MGLGTTHPTTVQISAFSIDFRYWGGSRKLIKTYQVNKGNFDYERMWLFETQLSSSSQTLTSIAKPEEKKTVQKQVSLFYFSLVHSQFVCAPTGHS